MNAKLYLKNFSVKLEKVKADFFKEQLKKAKLIDPVAARSIVELERYMQGGKNARGALTLLGYKVAGGKENKDIYMAALAVELFHNALVIHDDFVDNDEVRRGKPTVHKSFEKEHGEHYGASMAIVTGDVAIFLANEIFSTLKIDSKKVLDATGFLNRYLLNTGYGELMDIDFDFKSEIHWKEIFKVRIYKTAHYTFVMPLVFGAVLAGKKKKQMDALVSYGEPVGLAFQLRDDVLGVFGNSATTGKSTDSDIREGKKTLLYLKALELAPTKDSNFLKKWYGNKGLNNAKIGEIRRIIKISGALDYSDKAAVRFVGKGKSFIPKITKNNDLAETLSSLAEYMIEREK